MCRVCQMLSILAFNISSFVMVVIGIDRMRNVARIVAIGDGGSVAQAKLTPLTSVKVNSSLHSRSLIP